MLKRIAAVALVFALLLPASLAGTVGHWLSVEKLSDYDISAVILEDSITISRDQVVVSWPYSQDISYRLVSGEEVTLKNDEGKMLTIALIDGWFQYGTHSLFEAGLLTHEEAHPPSAQQDTWEGYPVVRLVHGEGLELLSDPPPVIHNNRTLLPLRALAEEVLSMDVQWDDATRTATITDTKNLFSGNTVEIALGESTAKVNGQPFLIDPNNPDIVPTVINGRIMVPVRFISEAVGVEVEWDGQTRTVTVLTALSSDSPE